MCAQASSSIGHRRSRELLQAAPSQDSLADILERVLDKGIVIAGDIQINLLDIELLTIKLRLVVASVDKAKEIGIDWWATDPMLNAGSRRLVDENHRLRERLAALERRLDPPAPGAEDILASGATGAREARNA